MLPNAVTVHGIWRLVVEGGKVNVAASGDRVALGASNPLTTMFGPCMLELAEAEAVQKALGKACAKLRGEGARP